MFTTMSILYLENKSQSEVRRQKTRSSYRILSAKSSFCLFIHIVALELKDPICHSNECQIGSFSSEATTFTVLLKYTTAENN